MVHDDARHVTGTAFAVMGIAMHNCAVDVPMLQGPTRGLSLNDCQVTATLEYFFFKMLQCCMLSSYWNDDKVFVHV